MIHYTAEQIIGFRPCLSEEEVRDLYAKHGRQGQAVPLPDILRCEDISASHRIWVALQGGPHIRPFLDRVVERAVRTHALPCKAAKSWAEKWLSGEDRSAETAWEVSAAAKAEAAEASARAAAAAARAAAEAAEAEAAAGAARAAAWAVAAACAAEAASRFAEKRLQLIELIEEVERDR